METMPQAVATQVGVMEENVALEVEQLQNMLRDPLSCFLILGGSCILNLVGVVGLTRMLWTVTKRQTWWPQAVAPQKALLQGMGFGDDVLADENFVCRAYTNIAVLSCHHFIAGCLAMPVILSGGKSGYVWFFSGCLMECGFDISDFIRLLGGYLYPPFDCLSGGPITIGFLIIGGVMHHSISMGMILPMLLYYPTLPSFHHVVAGLLLVAGLSFGTGSIKFTLDTNRHKQFRIYKLIAIFQFVTSWFFRGGVWFASWYRIMVQIAEDEYNGMWWGALVLGILMTLFNLLTLLDVTTAALKWIPKKFDRNAIQLAKPQVEA